MGNKSFPGICLTLEMSNCAENYLSLVAFLNFILELSRTFEESAVQNRHFFLRILDGTLKVEIELLFCRFWYFSTIKIEFWKCLNTKKFVFIDPYATYNGIY